MRARFLIIATGIIYCFFGLLQCKEPQEVNVRGLTRMEMVRLMNQYSLVREYKWGNGLCAGRFTDIPEKDRCLLERFFFLGIIDYDVYQSLQSRVLFSPQKPVATKHFHDAFRKLYGVTLSLDGRKYIYSKYISYSDALSDLRAISRRGRDWLRKAAEASYGRAIKRHNKFAKAVRNEINRCTIKEGKIFCQ